MCNHDMAEQRSAIIKNGNNIDVKERPNLFTLSGYLPSLAMGGIEQFDHRGPFDEYSVKRISDDFGCFFPNTNKCCFVDIYNPILWVQHNHRVTHILNNLLACDWRNIEQPVAE